MGGLIALEPHGRMPSDLQRRCDMNLIPLFLPFLLFLLCYLYFLDWSLVTTLWSGISPCMNPGQGDCVVWWDAWAAAGAWAAFAVAWVGVGVAAVSAYFVWRLGDEANRASNLAVSIARSEADRQRERDRKERMLLFFQLNDEVSRNIKKIASLQVKLTDISGSQRFVREYIFRSEVIGDLAKIEFPTVDLLVDRLHYLHATEGPALARSAGMIRSLNREYEAGISPVNEENLILHRAAICIVLDAMIEDLTVIQAGYKEAVADSGIDNAMIKNYGAVVPGKG
ncbi:hypothetical protein [Stenotrophomonas sp. PS02299]|uniref:hypothetical protein n=1 Tax=Stenotrophomonas TaxID=40323 RepID=UPI00249B7262|nr:hypothetical protein [Stenotrophomonas sp. PS02299]